MGQQASHSHSSTTTSGGGGGGGISGRSGYVSLRRPSPTTEPELDGEGDLADDYRWAYVGDSEEQEDMVVVALQQANHLFLKKVDKMLKMHEVTSAGAVTEVDASLRKLLYFVYLVDEEIERQGNQSPAPSPTRKPFKPSDSTSSMDVPMSLSAPLIRKPSTSVLVRKQNSTSPAISMRVRDLRRLDFFAKPSQEASIWVRRNCVMFILDPIRAVVMEGRVILMTPPEGMDRWHKALEQHLRSYESYNGNDEYANDGYTTDTGTQGTQGSGRGDESLRRTPFAGLVPSEASVDGVRQAYRQLHAEYVELQVRPYLGPI